MLPSTVARKTRPAAPTGGAYVALLRGINVGGKNRIPMKDLASALESAGLRDVSTYIQSGNVVFRADGPRAEEKELRARIERQIAQAFRLRVPVVLRSAAELATVAGSRPFGAAEGVHVGFLADSPAAEAVAGLDPERSPPDRFVVLGRDVFLLLPNGVARSRLTTAYFDTQLGTTMTVRNTRTVMALLEMIRG